jgi:hypothetical protein
MRLHSTHACPSIAPFAHHSLTMPALRIPSLADLVTGFTVLIERLALVPARAPGQRPLRRS